MDMKHDPNHGHCIDQLCCLGQTIEIMYLLTRCRPYCCDLSKWFITVSDHDTIWSDNIVLCDWECRWARQCRKWKCQGKRERRRIRKKGFSMPVLSFHIWQGAGALWAPQLTQGSQFSRMSSKAFVKLFPRVRHSYAVSLDAPPHCRAWKPSGSTWLSTGMKCLFFCCPKQSISYVIRGASHPFECPQCGLRFDRKSQLGYHVEKNHQQVLFLFLLSTLTHCAQGGETLLSYLQQRFLQELRL